MVALLGESVLRDELEHDGEAAEDDAPRRLRSNGLDEGRRHEGELGVGEFDDGVARGVAHLGVRVAELLQELRDERRHA